MFIWSNVFRGIAMGVTELVPGISGSTIAIFMGIYERLLQAINDITSGKWKKAFGFLFPLGLGMLSALLLFSHLIKYLIQYHEMPLFYFFVGLIIGILPFLWKLSCAETNNSLHLSKLIVMFISFILVACMRFINEPTTDTLINLDFSSYLYLFIAGWIASIALILPGISGSLIMMILGVYKTANNALTELNIPVIAVIGLGVCAGILITSRIIRYFFDTYKQTTYGIMLGLVSGSIIVIFPLGIPDSLLYSIICVLSLLSGCMTAIAFRKKNNHRS